MVFRPAFSTEALLALELEPAAITPEDILEGEPVARAKELFRSADGLSVAACWDCTDGTFRWYFGVDETVKILTGSVTVTYSDGSVAHLAAGDVGHFPAGMTAIWQVHGYVRKLAICRRALPQVLGLALRATSKLMRMMGLGGSAETGFGQNKAA